MFCCFLWNVSGYYIFTYLKNVYFKNAVQFITVLRSNWCLTGMMMMIAGLSNWIELARICYSSWLNQTRKEYIRVVYSTAVNTTTAKSS